MSAKCECILSAVGKKSPASVICSTHSHFNVCFRRMGERADTENERTLFRERFFARTHLEREKGFLNTQHPDDCRPNCRRPRLSTPFLQNTDFSVNAFCAAERTATHVSDASKKGSYSQALYQVELWRVRFSRNCEVRLSTKCL